MSRLVSHTLVRNGMPFIDLVLRQVLPFVHKSLITISEQSEDGTKEAIEALKQEFPGKISISFENVENPGLLTQERQKQLDQTDLGDWVLFLDDDDYWPTSSLEQIVNWLGWDVDGYAVNPLQIAGKEVHDTSWSNKWFTKFFRKQEGVHYKHPWPKDLIYKGDKMLYWKKNELVPKIDPRFIHLSYIKSYSFRKQTWAEKYGFNINESRLQSIPDLWLNDIDKIYNEIRKHK